MIAILLWLVFLRVPALSRRMLEVERLCIQGVFAIMGLVGLAMAIVPYLPRLRIPSWLIPTQHRMMIPLEGWIYMVILFVLFTGGMLTRQNTLILMFSLLVGPFIINGQMTFAMLQAVRIERQAPRRAMVGELFPVEITLSNRRPYLALWVMIVRDEIRSPDETMVAGLLFSRVSPRTSQSASYELKLNHRGCYQLGSTRVSSRFPLGLIERGRVFPQPSEILVYPRIGRISPKWKMQVSRATELVSQSQPYRGFFNDDFHSLREFRSGDNPRDIHWRSTARRGELILREFQQIREHTLSVVLDLYTPQSSRKTVDESVELALSFVASLLVERGRECRDGFLTLSASGQQTFRWEGQGHGTSLETLFDGLAVLSPGPASDIVEVIQETLQHASSSTEILVVSTRESPPPYQSLLTSRVNLLNVREASSESLLTFDGVTRFERMHPKTEIPNHTSGV